MTSQDTALASKVEDDDSDPYLVPGLQRGLAILQLFDSERRPLGLSEIARRIGVPRSSTFRLLYTLEALDFVERSPDSKGYRLSSRVLSLGFAYLSSVELVEIAREPLDRLRSSTGLSAHLAVREGREIVHLLRMPSLQPFTTNVQVGMRRPAHATPMGRVLLTEVSDADLAKLYPEKKLQKVTAATPETLKELRERITADRARGYVISYGTYTPNGCSVAAPIRDAKGDIVAAINIVGPRDGWANLDLEGRLKDEILATAAEISGRLGYRGR